MARPRIFLSSTFYDLKHIRSSIENFIEELGYESILSEKGVIAYNPDLPLDESCYREAESADIFVLIIGGRYGSPISKSQKTVVKDFFQRYESITKMEYESASKRDIPIYILIEKSVYNEYETFKNNRDNSSIKYAHVDSINIFFLIEQILNQPRNNPIHTFERHQEIEAWLKEQWSGLFRDLLKRRSDKNQISSLSKQVSDLAEINTTLKRYLEEVVSKVSEVDAAKIIKEEDKRLKDKKKSNEFFADLIVNNLLSYDDISKENLENLYIESKSLEDFASRLELLSPRFRASQLLETWRRNPGIVVNINKGRNILNLSNLEFSDKQSKTKDKA
ncbi:DUF4062 domain-containing protein [Flavihumibacter rivuli]|uniref:DUF4062 domain-containing protein n=1 Tax=Flavihumibacter rivuli TaxID=2838156 RepID=UPI001BDF4C8B|nr:DUF4062 domain-containing protein [Flavihumibacter rivuli]ULQ55069.1 DUF4062 domain-containing protein [Flavihumibacter rivuli]